MIKFAFIVAVALLIPNVSCKNSANSAKDSDSGTGRLALSTEPVGQVTTQSLTTLPLINTPGAANPGTLVIGTPSLQLNDGATGVVGGAIDNRSLQSLFAFHCWNRAEDNYGYWNFCPKPIYSAVEAKALPQISGDTKLMYEFGHFSLLGMIFHAQRDTQNIFAMEASGVKLEPTSLSFLATRDYAGGAISGGVGDKFLMRFASGYDSYAGSSGDGKHYFWNYAAASASSAAQKHFLAMIWYKMVNSTEIGGGAQTFIAVGDDGVTPRIFAINQVMSDTRNANEGSRMVLIMNFENNNFLYKGTSHGSLSEQFYSTVIAGKGGFDYDSSTWKEGAYFADLSGSTVWRGCVDSKSQTLIADTVGVEQCQFVAGFFNGDDNFAAADFLALNEQERLELSEMLGMFSDAAPLTKEQTPRGRDEAANIFDSVTFTKVE
jgi:hypothetical protein